MCIFVFIAGPSSPPTDLQLSAIDSFSVLVSWRPPLEPNGIIVSYQMLYSGNLSQPDDLWTNLSHDGEDTITKLNQGCQVSVLQKSSQKGFALK